MIMYVHAVKMVEEVPVCLSKSSVICFVCSSTTPFALLVLTRHFVQVGICLLKIKIARAGLFW